MSFPITKDEVLAVKRPEDLFPGDLDEAKELGLETTDLPWVSMNRIQDRYVEDAERMMASVEMAMWNVTSTSDKKYDHIVFEGAQGLRLDEKAPDFPHVTRSRTGLTNIVKLMDQARFNGINERLDIYYMTRPYLTRHGNGPLQDELMAPPYPGIFDRTNVPNPHQGTLRYAWLNPDTMAQYIVKDMAQLQGRRANAQVVITCMDQVPSTFQVSAGRVLHDVDGESLAEMIKQRTHLRGHLLFYGETREDTVRKAA